MVSELALGMAFAFLEKMYIMLWMMAMMPRLALMWRNERQMTFIPSCTLHR